MKRNAGDMTVEEFAAYLEQRNLEVIEFRTHGKYDYNGRHMRGFMANMGSKSLKVAMQRRRTQFVTKP